MLHWNRLSDHVGRKPVLLFGLLGTIVSITMFGLSRSFWSLALWYNFFDTLKYSLGDVIHFATVSQPLLEWRAQWERWNCQKCACRNCRRFERRPGVLLSSTFLCGRPGHRVWLVDFSPLLLLIPYHLRQIFCWWLLVATTRSLARILPAAFLGRIPIFPSMSGCGFLFPHSIHHCRGILRRGWLIDALKTLSLIY